MLMSHNMKVFEAAKGKLLKDRHIGIVQATGTGKSYCTAELLHFVNAHNVLYVIPKNIILEGILAIEEFSGMDVTFMSYTYLCNHLTTEQVDELGDRYDAVVFDEAHHLGAPTWRNPCRRLMAKSKYSIALTATPIRTDTGSNILEEFCGEKDVIYGLSLEEAIANGVLPQFKYYAVADASTRYTMLMKGEIDIVSYISNIVTVSESIKKYTSLTTGKWIVFCSNIKELEYTEQNVSNWFVGGCAVYSVHSEKSNAQNAKQLNDFKESKDGNAVLLCVDMINEGLHIKGVQGCIMLRKTSSPTIFEQQLGRVLSAGKGVVPVVIDVIDNYENLTYARDVVTRIYNAIKKEEANGATITIIDEYCVNDATLIDIEDIWKARPNRQRAEYLLKKYYKVEGARAFKRIVGMTKAECRAIVRKLGLKFSNRWTDAEIKILKEYFPTEGKDCYERLKNRTPSAVSTKAYSIKLRRIKK